MSYIVRLNSASSPSGVAYIGPRVSDGFATEQLAHAYRFSDKYDAVRFADHFRGQWRGFARFEPGQITVVATAGDHHD